MSIALLIHAAVEALVVLIAGGVIGWWWCRGLAMIMGERLRALVGSCL